MRPKMHLNTHSFNMQQIMHFQNEGMVDQNLTQC